MEIKEKGTLYFKKDGKFKKLCDCAKSPEVQEEVIKVELSEDNMIPRAKPGWLAENTIFFVD